MWLAAGYDAELRRHDEVLRRVAAVQPHDHVLDIGCGAGQTTRHAARRASAGSALGVDVSAAAIERARELARAEDLGNVTFELGDAQVHGFPPERFDLVISRFGTMFFDDPVAAFANIGRAMRPGGRLAMMVWQAGDRNEWAVTIRQAVGVGGGPAAFSLAQPRVVKDMLVVAGFAGVAITDVHEPVYYGPDVAAALDWVRGFASVGEGLKLPGADDRLRDALAAHLRHDGVWFDSRAWIVTAHRNR